MNNYIAIAPKEKKLLKKNLLTYGKILLIAGLLLLLFTQKPTIKTNSLSKQDTSVEVNTILGAYDEFLINEKVHAYIDTMTIEEKVGQLFIISFTGTTLKDELKNLIQEYSIEGVVILGNNIVSQSQLQQLISDIQNSASYGVLVATDQEGGTVARIPWDSAKGISQQHIGIVNRDDFAYHTGISHAQSLKSSNIHINFAPVLDVVLDTQSPLMSRSFSSNPDEVSDLGRQIIQAHHNENVMVAVKHFPGLGRTKIDTHTDLPQIQLSYDTLLNNELEPFKMAIEQDVEAIMIGHALYPEIDNEYPASLSRKFMNDILREDLGYEGIIITDDIRMDALNGYDHRALKAFQAGADMILVVDSYTAIISQINDITLAVTTGEISYERLDESVERILRLKYEQGIIE